MSKSNECQSCIHKLQNNREIHRELLVIQANDAAIRFAVDFCFAVVLSCSPPFEMFVSVVAVGLPAAFGRCL